MAGPLIIPRAWRAAARDAERAVGHFVWHDLITDEVGRAVEFYSNVFGWQVKSRELGPLLGPYALFAADGVEVGGIARSMRPLRRSHWLPYVAVSDVDATCRRAGELGGTVTARPVRVPNIGRFAIVTDPLGAVLSPIELERAPIRDVRVPAAVGELAWDDLITGDPEIAGAFWERLLEWRRTPTQVGTFGSYVLLGREGEQIAGIMRPPTALPEGFALWIAYVRVEDTDTTMQRAKLAGASAILAPFDLPQIGRLAIVEDPSGGVIAIYEAEE